MLSVTQSTKACVGCIVNVSIQFVDMFLLLISSILTEK